MPEARQCPGMQIDEELARPREIGRITHEVIATLAPRTFTPTLDDIQRAVTTALPGYAPIEARAHRQNIAAGVFAYFRFLLPPASWSFAGAEVSLGLGRIDLLWRDAGGRHLIDEVKTGSSRQLQLTRTHRQIETYLADARLDFGDDLVGARLLSTTDPGQSQFVHPDGRRQPLHTTPFRRTR